MDMSALLPLLMNAKGGNKNSDSNSGGETKSDGASEQSKKGGLNPADLLSMMNNNGGKLDQSALIQSLIPNMPGGGDGNLAQIMSLASAMNQNNGNNNRRSRPPAGIRPIKGFANNDVIGRLVKFFQ